LLTSLTDTKTIQQPIKNLLDAFFEFKFIILLTRLVFSPIL